MMKRTCAALIFLIWVSACSDFTKPTPILGSTNWQPKGIAGTIEVRKLPPSSTILGDYGNWVATNKTRSALVYEENINGIHQTSFSTWVSGSNTPLGFTYETEVQFAYGSGTNKYEFFWSRLGKHDLSFMNLGTNSRTVWGKFVGTNTLGLPRLEIVAFEGLEADWGVFAPPLKAGESEGSSHP